MVYNLTRPHSSLCQKILKRINFEISGSVSTDLKIYSHQNFLISKFILITAHQDEEMTGDKSGVQLLRNSRVAKILHFQ